MKGIRVANRYADSLLDLAIEKKNEDKVAADIKLLQETIQNNRDFAVMLQSPVVPDAKKAEILSLVFKGKVQDITINFFNLIVNNGRSKILSLIATQFEHLYKTNKNILVTEVISATKMDKTLEKELRAKIGTIHKGEIEMKQTVDASLIGGFILRIGDRQVDTSISRKLKDLKKVFSEN